MIDIDVLIKNSLKSGNKIELKTYRNLKAEFQKVKTAKGYKGDWNDKLEMQIISKYGRTLEEAIYQFSETHRDDLVSEYTDELEVLKKLLPEPVNESQICSELCIWAGKNKFIETFLTKDWGYSYDAIETSKPFVPKKEMGTVIKYLKSKFPTADGKMISEIVKKYTI